MDETEIVSPPNLSQTLKNETNNMIIDLELKKTIELDYDSPSIGKHSVYEEKKLLYFYLRR